MMFSMVTFPTATDTIAQVGAISAPWFTEFLNFIWLPVGVAVGVFVAMAIGRILLRLFPRLNGNDNAIYNDIWRHSPNIRSSMSKKQFKRWMENNDDY